MVMSEKTLTNETIPRLVKNRIELESFTREACATNSFLCVESQDFFYKVPLLFRILVSVGVSQLLSIIFFQLEALLRIFGQQDSAVTTMTKSGSVVDIKTDTRCTIVGSLQLCLHSCKHCEWKRLFLYT